MSGMAGWVDLRHGVGQQTNLPRSKVARIVSAMIAAMAGRGPDGQAVWLAPELALGHCRTVTSRYDGEEQPWIGEIRGATVAILYTGQIYNAGQLQHTLTGLGPEPDRWTYAEIIRRAYAQWGAGFVEHLEGMFAIALWDSQKRELLLARDRLGLQPLYYTLTDGGIIFASVSTAIEAHPQFTARLDTSALAIVLQPRMALPGETPLQGLHELPPATVLSFSERGQTQKRYWRLESAPHTATFEQTAEQVRALLEGVVARQYEHEVPCAAMLSGGIDSTSVAALVMKQLAARGAGAALDTFCLKFDTDEDAFTSTELRPDIDAPFAALAAEYMGTRHTTLSATMQDLLNVIPATRTARGLPGWGQFDASMYLLFERMRGNCSVALTGEAADEIFGGYPYYFKPQLLARAQFPWLGDGPKLADYLSPALAPAQWVAEDERARYDYWLSQVPRLPGESAEAARMREVLFLGMSGPLSVILDRKERMSMSQGLEVRVPFCDPQLIQYVWNVPWEMKSRGGVKGLLKAAMHDILPPTTLSRKKSAYPHIQDTEYDRALISEARWIATDPKSPIAWMFDTPRLSALIEQIAANQLNASMLPGGASPAHLLIQLVEMHRWIVDNRVAV
ncbi:asparagine synthase (glutamine-hydrolyzing) [Pseudomonas sessilinigenes]|uniref:asparagine synthase (glutamine-hydrolyzing) n=1 Tax=Pseudomonas sessilinigenes TaxID=658629 RepID=A0ABX8MMQ3_9PSED|nr:asparagine synthase (glutamine-hydrolyzing) [Pseudomonas sessilinigenes]AZC26572.1 Asparagine synthetase (glutamine-hydrolyzing) [Pseudomonas sessilinigenes]QXH39429.1 asparagine synthase (glutamine-hydrolyzing) [Pseudomonas sessilinigenes]